MRIPTYLSYSSLSQFEKDVEEFYLKHLSETRAARLPQERPASVGSAFDAYVKAALYAELNLPQDQRYEFEALFEAQVEPQNRDWARSEGQYVFDCYRQSGMYTTLLNLLRRSIEPPRFEFAVRAEIEGVPFLAKPDCRFVLPGPLHVVHDWKINGYCSKSATSPTKGYMLCCDGFVAAKSAKQNKSHGQAHKLFEPIEVTPGYTIDKGYLEDCSTQWADQLSLYGWSLGEKIGDSSVVLSIDQGVAKPMHEGRPRMRFASFRARVRQSYQEFLAKRLRDAWAVISSGHIFRHLSPEDSEIRCQLLDDQAAISHSDGSEQGDWFNQVVRPKYRG